ncbi:DUF4350 domain-containing protein [Ramlibacter sp. G-1-2-2]|uniref:DUF4350 domain-containing protein n=1 Tax=Ramlibacter agri TaxID=2728837 RepID=A0A848GYC1_9BURK|nr:DUF4350 domain-containing protein [Ramlibacter agri]NML43686.1 DUF4350 domain-containing protein [Ramlibacter agri]
MSRDTVIRIAVGGLALAGALWLANATEWVEVQVPRPPRGAAAKDSFFATEQVLKQMGARVERRQALEPLPPPGARLLLTSQYWHLFPERAEQLRRWIEAGGQLVVPATLLDRRELAWLPLKPVDRTRDAQRIKRGVDKQDCYQVTEPAGLQAPGSDGQGFRFCGGPSFWRDLQPRENVAPQWQLNGPYGVEMLRVPLGKGSVTAFGSWTFLNNREVLKGEHALALATALQLERGQAVWLVTEEARPPFLAWIWQNAWIAVLLAAAALAWWLWRGAVRFGPVGATPAPQRRSMREQVAGTGAFLQQHGTAALHAAQVRALQDAARARLPGFAQLTPLSVPQAIARATSLDANALTRALLPGPRTPERLPADLELLEAARRRLLQHQQRTS